MFRIFFFFNDTATTEIYTLSLHDALPIFPLKDSVDRIHRYETGNLRHRYKVEARLERRSEEHTSELQSRSDLVCRLLLEKKKTSRDLAPAQYLSKYRTRAILRRPP